MMPVRLCFENKNYILSFSYTKETKLQQSVWILIFFHLNLMVHWLFTFHYTNKYNILAC